MSVSRSPIRRIWEESPERVAWAVMLLSFFICVTLAVGTPLTVRAFLRHATRGMPVTAQSLQGTALLAFPGHEELAALTAARTLQPQVTVRTDNTSTAVLTVHPANGNPRPREIASVLLYNNTEVTLLEARQPRFLRWSPDPARVRFRVEQGRVRVVAGPFNHRPLQVRVETPHGDIAAEAASFSVYVTNQGMDVTVRQGWVNVTAQGLTVVVGEGQRTWVPLAQPPQSPVSAERNLIRNGNFTQPLETTWSVGFLQPENVASGTVAVVEIGGRRAVQFSRMAEEGVHTEAWIEQILNQDVQDVDSLVLRMDVRLLFQSLAGGGMLGSEYPLMVRIDFVDIYGKDQFWVHGFYFRDPPKGWPVPNGEKIPPFVWWPYESPNLITVWDQMGARPALLKKIRIYASGHNYQSMVAEVGLFAR